MIYMIEIDYADPASEAEWNAWYDGYMRDMVSVPGILTGQRFVAVTPGARRYLAVYALAGTSVYGDPRYKAVGGGGFASTKWRAHIRRRRNLYDGIDHVPDVTPDRHAWSCRRPIRRPWMPRTASSCPWRSMTCVPSRPIRQVRSTGRHASTMTRPGAGSRCFPRAADALKGAAVYRPTSPRLVGRS